MEISLMVHVGIALSEGLTGTGRSTAKKVHSCGARCWQGDSVPQCKGLSTSCLGMLVVFQPTSSRPSDPRQPRSSHKVSYDLTLEVTLCLFCSIIVSPSQ